MECVHCGSKKTKKYGKPKGIQRYKCNSCGKHFRDNPNSYTKADKDKAIEYYLNNCGVRKTARFIGCSSGTIIDWVREYAQQVRQQAEETPKKADEEADIIEMDEIYTFVKKTN